MSDVINRQDAYRVLTEYYHHRTDFQHEALKDALSKVPTIQPKRGEWIIDKEPSTQYGTIEFECSVCGMPYSNEHRKGAKIGWWFCPNCGADMRDAETIEYHKTLGDRWSGYGRKRR